MRGFFITGTDTNVGKTQMAMGLLVKFKQHGFKTIALKPVATGCQLIDNALRNQDACLLLNHITEPLCYAEINPIAFYPPIAPHLAAAEIQQTLSVDSILMACQKTLNKGADFLVIEGIGGWLVPLNAQETTADLAKAFGYPVILVVAIRLGCLNHALLTIASLKQHEMTLSGWIANFSQFTALSEIKSLMQNIQTLRSLIPAPLLGIVPYQLSTDPFTIAQYLDLTPVFAEPV